MSLFAAAPPRDSDLQSIKGGLVPSAKAKAPELFPLAEAAAWSVSMHNEH